MRRNRTVKRNTPLSSSKVPVCVRIMIEQLYAFYFVLCEQLHDCSNQFSCSVILPLHSDLVTQALSLNCDLITQVLSLLCDLVAHTCCFYSATQLHNYGNQCVTLLHEHCHSSVTYLYMYWVYCMTLLHTSIVIS